MRKAGHIGVAAPSRLINSARSPDWLERIPRGMRGGHRSRPFYSLRPNQSDRVCPPASIVIDPPMRRTPTGGVCFSQRSVRQSHFSKYLTYVAHKFLSSVSRFVFGNTDREGVAICARVHPVKRENHQRSLA